MKYYSNINVNEKRNRERKRKRETIVNVIARTTSIIYCIFRNLKEECEKKF